MEDVKSLVLQSPVPSPQASPRVEASERHKQAQYLSACRKVQMETAESILKCFHSWAQIPPRFSPCKPTQRWLNLQDLILRLKSKHVLTARCFISLTGLLTSTVSVHLKEHWRFPYSLDILLTWSETISAHLEWWQNPVNVMKDTDLHPKTTVSKSLQTPQTKVT